MTSWQQVRKSIDQPRSDVTGGSRGINQTKAIRFLFRIGSESICHLSMKLPIPRTITVKCIAITRRCTLFRVFFGKHEHKRPLGYQSRTTDAVQLPYIRIVKTACRTLVGAAAVP